jgi:hypothetical protein
VCKNSIVSAASSRSILVNPSQNVRTASLMASGWSSVSTEKSQWNGESNLFLKEQRTRYIEDCTYLPGRAAAHRFRCARDILRRAAALLLYLRPARPGPAPFNAVIAARTRVSCCSSFIASFFKAFRICIACLASGCEDITQCGR